MHHNKVDGRRITPRVDVQEHEASDKGDIGIAVDITEGVKFINEHGVASRDLNTLRMLLDKNGNACLGDMGMVTTCKSVGEALEYETDGYRWLAPEIIAGDPESITETLMSNSYSFGMVVWEMVTGEVAYACCSPVQAAVGIAACGLRPEIPKDCPQGLGSLMNKCWNSCPSKPLNFSEIVSLLIRSVSRTLIERELENEREMLKFENLNGGVGMRINSLSYRVSPLKYLARHVKVHQNSSFKGD